MRAANLVGRDAELRALEDCLAAATPSRLLLVHGPGGVGKSTLLATFSHLAQGQGWAVADLSCRELPAEPEAMARTLEQHAPRTFSPEGCLLVLDEFETLSAWEEGFRERFLPLLPDTTRIALGGRWQPAESWRTDPGWRRLCRDLPLQDFSPAETRTFLAGHKAGPERSEEVHRFTRGHPLAVALTADLLEGDPQAPLQWDSQPELIRDLVARHLRAIHDPRSLKILHAAAVLPRLDRPLLEAVTGSPQPETDLAWIADLPFSRRDHRGIHLHDLVREAVSTEMQVTEPDRHAAFIRQAAAELSRHLGTARAEEAVGDLVHLLRNIPLVRQAIPSTVGSDFYIEEGGEIEDLPALEDLVERFEGREARAWFRYWAQCQPGRLAVLRTPEGAPAGLSFFIDPFEGGETGERDPAAAAFRGYLAEYAPLRRGEKARLCRFVLAADNRLGSTPAATRLRSYNVFYAMRTPGLAFSGSVIPREQGINRIYELTNFPPLPGTEFRLDGHDYFLMGHDWRLEPPAEWVVKTTERLITGRAVGETGRGEAILPRSSFREAVREALKGLTATKGLADNPLLGCPLMRLAEDSDGQRTPEENLAWLVRQGIESLEASPEHAEHGQVLRTTYLQRAPKQRAVAERVGMSYGTYRRRLQEAVERLSERLWEWERAAAAGGAPPA